jgi:FkbM family methyltransferase
MHSNSCLQDRLLQLPARLLLLLLLYACFISPASCSLNPVLQGMEDFGANYVKLRDRPLYSSEDRPYIDLLVADFAQACAFLTRTICPPRNATLQVFAKGAYFNLRVPGDDYYPSRWAEQMLQRRVRGPDGLWHLNDEFQYFATLYEVVVKGQIRKGDLDEVNALSNICTLTTQLKTWALCLKQWMNTKPEFSNPCNNFGCSYLTQMGLKHTCRRCKKVSTLRTEGSSYQATVVSAYLQTNTGKHNYGAAYKTWMKNVLGIDEPMVVFTDSASVALQIRRFRAHAANRTLIVPTSIEECAFYKQFGGVTFWEQEVQKDSEAKLHRDWRLYIVYGEKTNWVRTVTEHNPFGTDFFAWMDIGYIRTAPTINLPLESNMMDKNAGVEIDDCLHILSMNMPVDAHGVMKIHHWGARSNKWNEEQRWLPMNIQPPCTIWYVGANTHGQDGVRLQQIYNCDIHVFEPVPSFASQLVNNWRNVPRSTVHTFGLGAKTRTIANVKVKGQSTFAMAGSKDMSGETVQIMDVVEAWEELGKPSIDLLHMNCEGCEWEMLERLISSDIVDKVQILQLGTHWFEDIKNIEQRYCTIESKLATTHRRIYQQHFGWERWEQKKDQRKLEDAYDSELKRMTRMRLVQRSLNISDNRITLFNPLKQPECPHVFDARGRIFFGKVGNDKCDAVRTPAVNISVVLHPARGFIGGGGWFGSREAIQWWHERFIETTREYASIGLFIGKDQYQYASVAVQWPQRVRVIKPHRINDYTRFGDPWFAMVPYLNGAIFPDPVINGNEKHEIGSDTSEGI